MIETKYKHTAEVGDVIEAKGLVVTIGKIYYQDYDRYSEKWDIEFESTDGVHRSWKQVFDGGEIKGA
jgi:hypothetical protein